MLINLRNALMAGKRLPYDAEVEYLESTGTQYIDTLVNADSNLSVEITMANAGTPWANTNPTGVILVLTSSQTRHHLNFSGSGVNYYYGNISNPNVQTLYKPNDSVLFTFKVDSVNKIFTLGDYSTALPTYAFDAGLSYWLFGRNGTTPPYLGALRVYSAKLWNGNTLVRDYIPVRKGTVGYLYDRVSGKLFGNAGTGDFVYGADVVPMTWQDGLQYNNVGTPIESATSSIGLDYIPITAGHSFTWRLGYGSSASADLIIYNANKERIDYWVARDRTVTISGAAAYMRISVLSSYKEQATVYDETAQKYVFANGKIPTGGAS